MPESGADAPLNWRCQVRKIQAEPTAVSKAELAQCLQKLQGVSFELAAAVDGFGDRCSRQSCREEVAKLGLKLEKQSKLLTTVGASMASEQMLEVNKLLKAFDRFAEPVQMVVRRQTLRRRKFRIPPGQNRGAKGRAGSFPCWAHDDHVWTA